MEGRKWREREEGSCSREGGREGGKEGRLMLFAAPSPYRPFRTSILRS